MRVLTDSGFDVVGTVGDARDLVRKARLDHPDVVVTDIQMPPGHADDGLRAALEIRSAQPGVGIWSPAWWGAAAGAALSPA